MMDIYQNLPDNYTPLSYVESTDGGAWIDTGIYGNQDTSVAMDARIVELVDGTSYCVIFGCIEETWSISIGAVSNNVNSRFGYCAQKGCFSSKIGIRSLYEVDIACTKLDGIVTHEWGGMTDFALSDTLCVGIAKNNSNYPKCIEIYECTIRENETEVMHLIPCMNEAGVCGMYDVVNSQFHVSSGPESFRAGSENHKTKNNHYHFRRRLLGSGDVGGLPAGTTYDFSYTGAVQSIELPRGRYKLQCWGAQGGNVTGTYAVSGSKGGYSEGVLNLKEKTTLYVFVGGQGASYTSSDTQTSTSVVKGGWNGGGAGVRTSIYETSDHYGMSFPRGGGGATDIALVTSTMGYSNGRTSRSTESLKSRIIVAGGGAGASAFYKYELIETTTTSWSNISTLSGLTSDTLLGELGYPYWDGNYCPASEGQIYRGAFLSGNANPGYFITSVDENYSALKNNTNTEHTCPANTAYVMIRIFGDIPNAYVGGKLQQKIITTETTSQSTSGKSTTSKQGGGTSGKGSYPGKQGSAGTGGAFGLGSSQSTTSYRYCGGGAGGGWYGGGTIVSNITTSYIDYCGGGSGFVNIAANKSYRPSGYTGLQLDSGTTTAGDTSHPSTSGGTETGHSGNGYARITVL